MVYKPRPVSPAEEYDEEGRALPAIERDAEQYEERERASRNRLAFDFDPDTGNP
jgi:hypothetical protein